jgi:hypothetical protein
LNSNFISQASLEVSYDRPASSVVNSVKDHRLSTLVLVLVLALSGFVPQVALAAAWSPTAPMSDARTNFTATLLANGKVLMVGGYGSPPSYLPNCELYDPAANGGAGAWSPTGSLATARYGQTATLLPNGKILVAGGTGTNYGVLQGAELFNLAGFSPAILHLLLE